MSFGWRDFLTIARELVTQLNVDPNASVREARRRVAISRAYYAAFGTAQQVFVERAEFHPSGTGADHEALTEPVDGPAPPVTPEPTRGRASLHVIRGGRR
jgi:hypothetical protein